MPVYNKAVKRLDELCSAANLAERQKMELMSVVCKLVCDGKSAVEIREELKRRWPELAKLLTREDPWKLVRAAGSKGLLTYRPPIDSQLAALAADQYAWEVERMTVVHSPDLEHVAARAAERLLEQIRGFNSFGGKDTVHVGFAGGRLLRKVAIELAKRLQLPAPNNPKKIVFHAMVAGFSDDDFEADPNNFIAHFDRKSLAVDIGFVPMGSPGIVETALRSELRNYRALREIYEAAKKLNIIVTSGGDWHDEHSMAHTYLKKSDQRDVEALNQIPAIGDLLWQPVSDEGPIEMNSDDFIYRPNTLLDLSELHELIEVNHVRVLLALGPCGKCGKPKGKLLNTILNYRPRLVTDIVTNSRTVLNALEVARKSDASQLAPKTPKKAR